MKAHAGILALFTSALLLASCGGDAESAADPGSVPLLEEGAEEMVEGAPDSAVIPPSRAPAPESSPRPAPERTRAPTPPAAEAPLPLAPSPEESAAEESAAEEGAPEEVRAIPVGTRIEAVMESTLSTQSHEAGAIFRARIGEAIRGANGMELVPAGARIEGRVLESRGTTDRDQPAVLMLAVESLLVNGERFPIRATVESAELEVSEADSGTRSAATVATGAAAGAVVGQILGRSTRSTVVGAAAGAAAGAGVALTTRSGHAVLREGSVLTLRLDEPVALAPVR